MTRKLRKTLEYKDVPLEHIAEIFPEMYESWQHIEDLKDVVKGNHGTVPLAAMGAYKKTPIKASLTLKEVMDIARAKKEHALKELTEKPTKEQWERQQKEKEEKAIERYQTTREN